MRRTLIGGAAALLTATLVAGAVALGGTSTAAPQKAVPQPAVQLLSTEIATWTGYRAQDSEVRCLGNHVSGSFTIDPSGDRDPRSPEQIIEDIAKRMVPDRDKLTLAMPYRAFAADGREIVRQVTLKRVDGTKAALFTMIDVGTGALVIETLRVCS